MIAEFDIWALLAEIPEDVLIKIMQVSFSEVEKRKIEVTKDEIIISSLVISLHVS